MRFVDLPDLDRILYVFSSDEEFYKSISPIDALAIIDLEIERLIEFNPEIV